MLKIELSLCIRPKYKLTAVLCLQLHGLRHNFPLTLHLFPLLYDRLSLTHVMHFINRLTYLTMTCQIFDFKDYAFISPKSVGFFPDSFMTIL